MEVRDLEAAVQLKYMLIRLLSNYTSFLTLLSCQRFSSFELHAKAHEDFRLVLKSFARPPLNVMSKGCKHSTWTELEKRRLVFGFWFFFKPLLFNKNTHHFFMWQADKYCMLIHLIANWKRKEFQCHNSLIKRSKLIDGSFNMQLKKLDPINLKLTVSGTITKVYILNVGTNLENT